jgi:CDP-2,3-bis-(O-geranylgeranyl)-sn-glycerol synthase
MIHDILLVLWLFVPAAIANGSPVFAAKLPVLRHWNTPVDLGASYRGKRILGDHKTWRGLIIGMVVATITLYFQHLVAGHIVSLQHLTQGLDYQQAPLLILGPLFGLGALGGDAVKSFFKRLLHIQPGKSWFPFDQLDYIIGACLAVLAYIQLSLAQYLWALAVWLFIHVASVYIGYLLHLRERPI